MQIRRANLMDEAKLATVRRDAILTLAVPTLSEAEAEQWAQQVSPERFVRALREHTVWVAVAESVIGWVEIDEDRIAALYVSPTHASQGIGSALLAVAETAIDNAGYTLVRLEASRNALAFYLRRGYLPCGKPDADGAQPLCKEIIAARRNS